MVEDIQTSMAQDALRQIPLFAGRDLARAKIERLGGLTNLVFRLDLDGRSYCLRVPGKGTEEYINRVHEEHAAREAARAGVSPGVLYFDVASGLMVSDFVAESVTMSAELFKKRHGAPARAAVAFRKLHRSGAVFRFRFELFAMIDGYLKVLAGKKVEFPAGYHDVLNDAETVRTALAAHPLPVAACHCDPLAENFLDTGERMWIVDWEYSGMNDPMWDLGDLSVEASFAPEQDAEMIGAYFDGEASPSEMGRIVIYKAMCDLLWTLWGLIQHANQNPADDFWSYAVNRFRRCRALMGDPAFGPHVEAVRRG
jgi:thiamine kinase-like enzyme